MLVVDMIEQGLDHATQEAVIAPLRRRGPGSRPLFMLTRSSAILDLAAMTEDEAIILCPANHSPPTLVAPYPGAPGYEAVGDVPGLAGGAGADGGGDCVAASGRRRRTKRWLEEQYL